MKLDLATGLQGSAANISRRDMTTRSASQLGVENNIQPVAQPEAKQKIGNDFERSLDRVQKEKPVLSDAKNRESAPTEAQSTRQNSKSLDEAPEAKGQKSAQQTARQIFLNNMQSELGVSSEKILQAFSELDIEQLTSSPEMSAEAFVAKLGLDQQKSLKALDFYNEMLAMTAMAGMSNYLVHQGQQAQVQVLDPKEAQAQSLRRSLGDMSDRFFVTGKHAVTHNQKALVNTPNGSEPMASFQEPLQIPTTDFRIDQGMKLPIEADPKMDSESSGAFELGGDWTLESNSTPIEMGQGIPAETQGLESAQPNLDQQSTDLLKQFSGPAAQSVETPNVKISQGQQPYLAQQTTVEGGAQNLASLSQATTQFSDQDSEFDDQSESLDGYQIDRSTQQLNSTSQVKTPTNFVVGAPQPTEAEVNNNVQELISKAQFLAQKGGGEMKVTLRPDGLGEVNLRVQMQDGSVNVEMVTESNEAKKIIEKGLDELKHSLASHKLSLDSIKIDTGKETSNQMDQRSQDLERGFQQKFLGDFQQRNNNFRREMVEFQSAGGVPTSQTRDRAMNSRYDSGQKRKSDSSRRLDLVA